MPRTVPCPSCGRLLRLDVEAADTAARCPACDAVFHPTPDAGRDRYTTRPTPRAAPPRRPNPLALPRRQPSSVPTILFLIGGALVLAAAAGTGAVFLARSALNPPAPPPPAAAPAAPELTPEQEEERRREVREALAREAPLADAELAKQLEPFFAELGAAYRARDGDRLAALYDAPRMYRGLVDQGLLPEEVRRDPDGLRGLRSGITKALPQQAELINWATIELRAVKRLGPTDVVVIARHKRDDAAVLKLRWWLSRESGQWRVYDLEDLDIGLPLSALMGEVARLGLGGLAELNEAVASIRTAALALSRADLDSAEKALAGIALVKLPASLDAVRWLLQGAARVGRHDFDEALAALDRADKLRPEMPSVRLLRGVAHNGLGQWDKALPHLDAYRDLLGEDAVLNHQRGVALQGVRRFAEAAASQRRSLDEAPDNGEALRALIDCVEGEDQLGDIADRFARLSAPREWFPHLAEAALERKFPALLDQVVRGARRGHPTLASPLYYAGLARAIEGKADEAVKLFQAATRAEADAEARTKYRHGFLKVMGESGAAAAAYAAMPDREAFAYLARAAKDRGDTADLKALLRAHAAGHAGDVLLPFYRGEALAREGRYASADRAFAQGMKAPPDAVTLGSFRANRALARARAAGPVAAYREVGPRGETFAQLAELLLSDGDLPALGRLLDEHARHDPHATALAAYRLRLAARQGKPAAARLYRAALARQADDAAKARLTGDFLHDMAQAGRAVEAYRVAPDGRRAFAVLVDDSDDEPAEGEGLAGLIAAHRQRHPDDPALALHDGLRLLEAKAPARAATVLLAAWARANDEGRARLRHATVGALYQTGQWARAYEEIGPRDQTFAQLAFAMRMDRKGGELERLVAAQRHRAPATPGLAEHAAFASLLRGRKARALALFRQHSQATPKPHLYSAAHALVEAGLSREASVALPDAFRELAGALLARNDTAGLVGLLEAHRRRRPDDPYLLFYQGELYLRRGDALQAERHFALARARGAGEADWMTREALARARVAGGRAVAAYREAGRTEAAFGQLARACEAAGDGRQLDALIAAHRAAHGGDADVVPWQVEARWLRRDAGGAVRLLVAHRGDLAHHPQFRWKYADRLVRGLVRLGRLSEAVREAEAAERGGGVDAVLLVLVHAARGDADRAAAAVAGKPWRGPLLSRCYADADLGPLLRGPALRAFREKYPEVKAEVGKR